MEVCLNQVCAAGDSGRILPAGFALGLQGAGAEDIGFGVGGFVIGAGDHLAHDAGGKKLDGDDYHQYPQQQQWPVADILAKKQFQQYQIGQHQPADGADHQADAAEEVSRPRPEAHKKVHEHQVQQHPIGARDTVF